MARGLACKKMRKYMNWVMYAKWTNSEYQHHKSMSYSLTLMKKGLKGSKQKKCMTN